MRESVARLGNMAETSKEEVPRKDSTAPGMPPLLLMMALRHISASASLLQRSSSSRSTVRTLMQWG